MGKWLMLILAAGLAGCFQVGPDYQKPQVPTPKHWRFGEQAARNTSNMEWWELLGDPVLDKLVEKGLRNNLDLKIAVARVEQFMGLYGATRANLFPQISYSVDYLRRKDSTKSLTLPGTLSLPSTSTDYARMAAAMDWELDVWGALRRANEAAMAEMLAQEYVKRGVILTLASDIAVTYIQLRAQDKNLEITQAVVKALAEQRRIDLARFREGYISELEVTQVESEYQRRLALIPVAEQEIAKAENALSVLLGENPGRMPRGRSIDELTLPPVPRGLPSDLLARRPDIQQAEQLLIAANAKIGVARGQYFPRVALTGDVGQLSTQVGSLFTPGANFWTIGTTVLGPIFTAGRIAGQVAASEAVQRQALATYRLAIITAFKEFENALITGQKSQEAQVKESNRVGAVERYYKLSKLQYDEGLIDYITVLDSLRQLYEAQIALLQAQGSSFVASIELYRAMGGGWIVAKESENDIRKPPDPPYLP